MRTLFFLAVPFAKEEVTLALESGVDGIIVDKEHAASVASLARCRVIHAEDVHSICLSSKEDEAKAASLMPHGLVLLEEGWEIIPVENLLAQAENKPSPAGDKTLSGLALMASSLDAARLAATILQKGVDTIVIPPKGLMALKNIVAGLKFESAPQELVPARITEISPAGMGHRVCVDTLSVFKRGEGMLVGNSAAFTFLVNAETEHNEYVASRPFRINAGAVHAYALMPNDTTAYLDELRSGSELLIADHKGNTQLAVAGRIKVERRPMLLVRAQVTAPDGTLTEGAVFLQNAETIRLVTPQGEAKSVVALQKGDTVLCRLDVAGRHFGMRITEDIQEV